MVLYNKSLGIHSAMCFNEPNNGGGSGGSSGTSGQEPNQAGQQQQQQVAIDPKWFDSIPMDELDDDTRATIEKIKTGTVATLQRNQELTKNYEILDRSARQFQSEADKLKAEKQQSGTQQKTEENADPHLDVVTRELQAAGYTEAEIKKLAPTFAGMFKGISAINRKQIGDDLKPLAITALSNQAVSEFQMAKSNDPLGMLEIPEVAEKVWATVRERVGKGMENNADFILNLSKMYWADHQILSGGKEGQQQQTQTGVLPVTPPGMSTGGFTYPGAGSVRSIAPTPNNPNAARTTMNDDTAKALAASFGSMLSGFEGKVPVPSGLKGILTLPKGRR
jgi:hypothetical protein